MRTIFTYCFPAICSIRAMSKDIGQLFSTNSPQISNLQALCSGCDAMKRDRDDTDFRAVRREYDQAEEGCLFCTIPGNDVLIDNRLGLVIRDKYPLTDWHLLVVPKRHTADYFDLGTAESRACHRLITETRSLVCKEDPTVAGFNVGNQQRAGCRSNCEALPH
jgi:ATP adenylyltransferase